jgi:hypothetical protein
MYIQRDTEARSYYFRFSGKAIRIIYALCAFIALGIKHAMRMRHIVICGLLHSTNIFPHYALKVTILREKNILNIKCVSIFCTTFVRNISYPKTNWTKYVQEKHVGIYVRCSLFMSEFNETWNFSSDFIKNTSHIFMKLRPLRAELFRGEGQKVKDRQTGGHEETNSSFWQFWERD